MGEPGARSGPGSLAALSDDNGPGAVVDITGDPTGTVGFDSIGATDGAAGGDAPAGDGPAAEGDGPAGDERAAAGDALDPPARVTEIGAPERVERGPHRVATVVAALALAGVAVLALVGLGNLISDDAGTVEVDEVVLERYVGRSVDEAQRALERLNVIVDVRYEANETIPVDIVSGQEPVAGARVEVGELVVLVASDGPVGLAVPDLTSLSGPEAVRLLGTLGFESTLVDVFDEVVPPGEVVGSVPAAGVRAPRGSAVEVRVSSGPEPRVVPEIVGVASVDAFAAIGRADLTVGDVTRRVSDDQPPGTVLSSDPAPGAQAPRDQPVDVVIATDVGLLQVPDLVGLTRASAATVAEGSGFDISIRTEAVPSGDRRAGLVIRQSPITGSPAARGSSVTVVVGAAPSPPPTTTTTTAAPATTTTTPG